MELLYLWIENDGITIKNQAFNFSNHISFVFEKTNNNKGLLSITENPNFIYDFFDEKREPDKQVQQKFGQGIVNLTGIIGENGVGKTNLLNYIIDLLTDHLPIGRQFIIAFKNEEKEIIDIFHTLENFTLNVRGSVTDFSVAQPIQQKVSIDDHNYFKVPSNFADNYQIIYYSPAFDLRNIPPTVSNENKEYIDISTNALIEKDVIRIGDSYPDEIKEIELHKGSNIRRQLDMLMNPEFAALEEINLPKEITISFYRDYFDPTVGKRNLSFENVAIFDHFKQLADEAWQSVNSTLNSIEKRYQSEQMEFSQISADPSYRIALATKLKIEFCNSLFQNFFYNLNSHYQIDIGIKLEEVSGTGLLERASYFFKNQKWKGQSPDSFVGADLLFISVLELIDTINFDKHRIDDNANSFVTDIPGGIAVINNYEDYISSIPADYKRNFISTNWRNLSSGESALMDLYSRLYFAKNRRLEERHKKLNQFTTLSNQDEKNTSFIYLLIDEGEFGFHPQWQSQYLFNLINFVKHLFNDYKVQIILSSHSHFLVSDLPKENLIFLEKENGLCKVTEFNKDQTFAGNIHSLLSSQFFLKDGVIGKFAQTKLQRELKPLLEKTENPLDKIRLAKIIALIGEPVLRSKLLEILHSK